MVWQDRQDRVGKQVFLDHLNQQDIRQIYTGVGIKVMSNDLK